MNILLGKMEEAVKLMDQHMVIVSHIMKTPKEKFPMRTYRPFIGGGDSLHTMIVEVEWDSLSAMSDFFERVMAVPEMQELTVRWGQVEKSHQVDVLTDKEENSKWTSSGIIVFFMY
jgi:hypothetical protein